MKLYYCDKCKKEQEHYEKTYYDEDYGTETLAFECYECNSCNFSVSSDNPEYWEK